MNKQEKGKFDFHKSIKKGPAFPFFKYFPIERYFTRPLASLIVRVLYNTSVTPNQITIASFLLGICSAIAYCGGAHKYFILGGFLAQTSSILDCSDGMLARAKNLQSRFGAFLDLYLDRIGDSIVLGGMTWGYYSYSNNPRFIIIGIVGIALLNLNNSLYYLVENYKQDGKTGKAAANRGFLVFIIFILSVLNRLDLMFYIMLIYPIASMAHLTAFFFRSSRDQNYNNRF